MYLITMSSDRVIALLAGLNLILFSVVSSCTPFKISSYQECDDDQDCVQGFEVCNGSQLCQTQGALCQWSTSYEAPFTSTSDHTGLVIGVLADDETFSVEGSQSSAYLGIHTGLTVVSNAANLPSTALLICDSAPQYRETVLKTFREYQARVIIGSPELINLEGISNDGEVDPSEEAYISLGLNPASVDTSTRGWLNLRPPGEDLDRAFESVSTNILDYLVAQEKAFNVILPVAQVNPQPDYIQDLIWRMSPYMESIFRTLVVYYQPLLVIDKDIQDFLKTPRPLRLILSHEPLTQDKISEMTQVAAAQSISPSAQGPLFMYVASWDVNHIANIPQGYWNGVVKMSVIYGQYPSLNTTYMGSQEDIYFQKIEEGAISVATQLGGGNPLGTSYFGLAYDAGVIAGLVSLIAGESESPRQVLDRLILSEADSESTVYLSEEMLAPLIPVESLFTNKSLVGMSGRIKSQVNQEDAEAVSMFFVCSKDGQTPQLFPIERLNEMGDDLSDGITQKFRVPEETLIACERQ